MVYFPFPLSLQRNACLSPFQGAGINLFYYPPPPTYHDGDINDDGRDFCQLSSLPEFLVTKCSSFARKVIFHNDNGIDDVRLMVIGASYFLNDTRGVYQRVVLIWLIL